MIERKIAAMHRRFGTKEHLCRDCDHLIGGKYHNKQYYKCELYGVTHSEATDWRLSYQACGMYNQPVRGSFEPVMSRLTHGSSPIDGQIGMEVDDG